MEQTNLDRFYILVFTILGLILRLLYISQYEIALDEPFSIGVAQLPLNEIPSYLSAYNNPPLFELLLHPIVQWWGIHSPWVRLLSAVASSLTVIFIYLIGSRFFNRRIAVSASLLYTFSTFQITFAHEASVYALFNMLACASMFLLLTLHKQERIKWHTLILFTVVSTLLVYSHYLGWVVWVLQVSWLIAVGQYKQQKWIIWISFLLVVILYIPQFEVMWVRFSDASQTHWVEPPTIADLYYNLMKMMNAPVVAFIAIALGLLAAIKAIVAKQYQQIPDHTLLVLHWLLTAYFSLFFVSIMVPVFVDRYLIFVSGGLYLCLAIGMDYLLPEERSWPIHGVLAILFMLSVNLKPDHGRRWKGLVEQIASQQTTRTCVVLLPEWTRLAYAYHTNEKWFSDFYQITTLLNHNHCYPVNNLDDWQTNGADSLFDRIILVDGSIQHSDRNKSLFNYFKQSYTQTSIQKPFSGVIVYTFEK